MRLLCSVLLTIVVLATAEAFSHSFELLPRHDGRCGVQGLGFQSCGNTLCYDKPGGESCCEFEGAYTICKVKETCGADGVCAADKADDGGDKNPPTDTGGTSEGRPCGTGPTDLCDEGYDCVDDPSDKCDPTKGNVDCAGICKKKADDNSGNPDNPDNPDKPDNPDNPDKPDDGDNKPDDNGNGNGNVSDGDGKGGGGVTTPPAGGNDNSGGGGNAGPTPGVSGGNGGSGGGAAGGAATSTSVVVVTAVGSASAGSATPAGSLVGAAPSEKMMDSLAWAAIGLGVMAGL